MSGNPAKFSSEISTIHDSVNCIDDVITDAFNGSDVQQKWNHFMRTDLENVSAKFAECYFDGPSDDAFNCVLTYAFELNEAIENFFENLGDVRS